MRQIRAFLLTSVALLFRPGLLYAQDTQPFKYTASPGQFGVGLHVVNLIDHSRAYRYETDELGRPFAGDRGRPLQTLIWYPSEKSSETSMTVSDYGNLFKSETRFDDPRMPVDYEQWITGMAATLNDHLWAVRDAKAIPGRFPVVIYAPSYSAMSWENADLCEFLSTYGYIVLAAPSMGVHTRDMTSDLSGIGAQARDISFLIGYAESLPNADSSEIAVAGFSWGGISNLFAASRDSRIRALIAFDGSMRYFPGLVKRAGDIHPELMDIPMLFFTQGEITPEDTALHFPESDQSSGPNVLNEWSHGDLITIHMLGLVHAEFSSMYQRNEDIWKEFPEARKADYKREDGILGYSLVSRYTLRFLDAYLKKNTEAAKRLQAASVDQDIPAHFVWMQYRAAAGIPATFESFRSELGKRGFAMASEIYGEFKQRSPEFRLDDTALASWVYQLETDRHFAEAIELLKLTAKENPKSSAALDNLADAYVKAGEIALAVETYKLSLAENHDDSTAAEKLQTLLLNAGPERR